MLEICRKNRIFELQWMTKVCITQESQKNASVLCNLSYYYVQSQRFSYHNTCRRLSYIIAHRNNCQQLSQWFTRRNTCRIAHRIAHCFRLLTDILSVYQPQCSSNSASDGVSLLLVDSYPNCLRAAILVDSYPVGLRAAILVNGYCNSLLTEILVNSYPVGLRAAILLDGYPDDLSAPRLSQRFACHNTCQQLSQRFKCCNTCRRLSQRFVCHNSRRIVHRIAHRLHSSMPIAWVYTPQCSSNSASAGVKFQHVGNMLKNQIFELQWMTKVWVTQESQKKCECLVKPKLLL